MLLGSAMAGGALLVGHLWSSRGRWLSPTTGAPPPEHLEADAGIDPQSPRAKARLWKAALEHPDSTIDLERLAQEEGATGLLQGLEDGGAIGRVALEAMPFAPDGEIALSRLAELIPQVEPSSLGLILDAIEGVVQHLRLQDDRENPEGITHAFSALVAAAKQGDLSTELRARAVSIAREIADRAPVSSADIPTQFDAH